MRLTPTMFNRLLFTFLGFIVLSVMVLMVRTYFQEQHLNRGLAAYEQGDCNRAILEMNAYLKNIRKDSTDEQVIQARAIQTECKLFGDILTNQKVGKVESVLVVSAQLAEQYPNSLLMPKVQGITNGLFARQPMAVLAKPSSCKEFKAITQSLMPQDNAPSFYQTCGKVFENNQNYTEAVSLYETFFDRFPKHALTSTMLKSYSQVLYAKAKAEGAGNIPPPSVSQSTGDGSTVIEIRNDSPEKMQIVFGGPTPRIEELPACTTCETYTLVAPLSCPEKGPVGRYTVEPGDYKVVVKSMSGQQVRPFIGNWSMAENTVYSHCFYVVRNGL
jgi:hypothetical protein